MMKFSLGLTLWDQFALNVSVDGLLFEDEMPFSEEVVTCVTSLNPPAPEHCSDPMSKESTVDTTALGIEAGYQWRFGLDRLFALVPGLMLGYHGALAPPGRGVACQGCHGYVLRDFDASGAYVAPFARLTMASFVGFSARWQWFLSGDLGHALLFGIDLGYL